MRPHLVTTTALVAGAAAAFGFALVATPIPGAHAQGMSCLANDVACRVQHNDSAVLGQKLDKLDADMLALTKALQGLQGGMLTTAPSSSSTSTPTTTPTAAALVDPCASTNGAKWSSLTVDPTMSINAALACAAPGFKLALSPGVYKQVFHVPDGLSPWDIGGPAGGADTVKLDGQGGCTVSQNGGGGCPTRLAWGKGVAHAGSAGSFHDFEVRAGGINAQDGHDGQAGIYLDGGPAANGTVTIAHVMFRQNENGLFVNNTANFDTVVTESDFVGNGTDWGSHSAYVAGGASLTLNNIRDYGSAAGNDQKSRVPKVTVNGGFFKSNQGRWIEAADGATMDVHGATLIGQECCQNVFGNGTESTSKGPGNTTIDGVQIWIGRYSDFSNAGTFNATNTTLVCGPNNGPAPFNDKGLPLNGLPGCTSSGPMPAMPGFISGAKS